MGFFSFFFGSDEHQLDDEQRKAAEAAASRATRSLDIDVAIMAHENWKLRLESCLHGTSHEHLTAEKVGCDDACDLGKWIYGDGEQHLGKYATFTELRNSHRQFHQAAANVLTLANSGHRDEAEVLLHGEFERMSNHVNCRLRDLKALR